MINLLTPEVLAEVVAAKTPPCLSLCQRRHLRRTDNQQDFIRFGNLEKQLGASLLQAHRPGETGAAGAPGIGRL